MNGSFGSINESVHKIGLNETESNRVMNQIQFAFPGSLEGEDYYRIMI